MCFADAISFNKNVCFHFLLLILGMSLAGTLRGRLCPAPMAQWSRFLTRGLQREFVNLGSFPSSIPGGDKIRHCAWIKGPRPCEENE